MIGSILYSDTRYNPIVPTYLLEVVNSTGTVLTSRRFDAVSGVAPNQMTQEAVNKPVSTSFSHTFVLEDMPPEDDPTAPEHWAYVRLSMRWYPVWSGTFGGAVCKALGGTKLTSMTASRWSRDVANTNQPATVPDGGTLT
ncbi:hypothetical protein JOJ87_001413 [Rhodococcus ruber]|uniref:hypothetical protein n=1 Tax=Rhodococcus ruber TaxID=1830 RepID=UPI001AE91CC8|nr:hypothetical protein [Rhodococcus ruber]MBP2211069.1 hypothetical protein [Rhodococcus ruber]